MRLADPLFMRPEEKVCPMRLEELLFITFTKLARTTTFMEWLVQG